MFNKITSILLAIFSVALLYMGIKLALVGGSIFYFIIAIGSLLCAILLFLNKRIALSIYAVLMWMTLIWIIWEVGFDKWQWIPRGDLIALFGAWLALPWVVKPLYQGQRKFHPFLGTTVILMILLVLGMFFYDPLPKQGEINTARAQSTEQGTADNWSAYGGTTDGLRFSRLSQINKENVKNLEVAWTYHTGDLRKNNDAKEYTFEATPLKVNGMLYLCTPHNEVHALNPENGQLNWKYVPTKDRSYLQQHQTCRGVSYYEDVVQATNNSAKPETSAVCPKRIFNATADSKLVALNADTGKVCSDFGQNGVIDLSANMGKIRPHALMQTAAPLVAGNLVILGSSVMDNGYDRGNPSGVIRAYDVHTGRLVWNFDPANPSKTQPIAANSSYPQDTPVAWGTLSADIKNGIVYVPFGNASPDEIGTARDDHSTAEQFRDALVALDLKTGALKWRFQSSHHDLWDRDNPSQPSLVDINYQGKPQPVVILPTKVGNIFVLNRLNGQPVYPIQMQKTSTEGGITGEKYASSQPVSALNFIPEKLTEKSMWGITPFDQIQCRIDFKGLRYDGNPWTPPTEAGSLIFPGNIGVFNWGSVAIDPQRQLLVASPIRLAYKYNLIKRDAQTENTRLFTKNGEPYWNENFQGKYAIHIQQFASSLGIPCITPPWGRLAGVDLQTGKTEWLRRIGNTKNLKTSFLPGRFPIGFNMGMVAHGGPLLTAGDIIFHGATADNFFRAYNSKTGELLWQTELSAGAQSTPSTFIGKDGKQYVVIAAGGHGSLGTTEGDSVVAFRLK
ncbi:membrane-bound PQQ-dependent dehydrogenase, glucose/quinate/shikimate family [Acinetobacter sp. MD2(2019)]|uniref:membrane-bound PQQ-dependent dehydrogenase, glucose/quinate/shikimate family n=1 Tax=Acinetobacter sp. MD2(2019) TaxID=2605273 RepID=UPI002D1F1991|nr:membrane-bound PQQ-dependent dehydrogenase, glucose/quinate/shikimate family [Acinetobacter sp. MD2(2019)]MEB3753219.1 membrane-bound PQQ-dependent dehydrogenase, glucose/quinate/shikimate family [Acinetobacter sp. MD2(2019)]